MLPSDLEEVPEDIAVVLDLLRDEKFDPEEVADLYFYYQLFHCEYTRHGVCLNQLGICGGCHFNYTLKPN